MTRPRIQPVQLLLLGAVVAAGIGQGVLYWWYVEDSAISMAFARNLADGWGLVRFPGDARVEGYSNPLWVFYMALGYLVGVDGFASTKVAAGLLGCLVSVPVVGLIAWRAKIPQGWAWVASWVLALDAQFIIWSACGLENGLFCALLALGCLQTLREADKGGFPWAAVWFFGLALTRPEGIVYAALGGVAALVFEAVGNRRWGRIAAWLAVFWVPFAAYHAVRFNYFAFEFPATYYAKLEEARFNPWAWHSRAWMYLRDYSLETSRAWFLPVFVAGALSLRGWRGVTAVGLSLWLAVVLVYPGVEPLYSMGWPRGLWVPSAWIQLRIVSLGLMALAIPLLALGSEGWRSRSLMWGMALIGLLFALRSTGDWMRGFRWLSLVSVPLAVLFAIGCAEIAQWVERRGAHRAWRFVGIGVAGVVLIGAVTPQVVYQVRYQPEVGPFAMKRRVDHYGWAMQKLFLERAHIIDHDMGAMLYWGGEHGLVRDAKGLIDYPFALHHANPRFVKEYIFEEHPFDLAHAHASTGRAVRRVRKQFEEEFIEFPGYGGGAKIHVGNYVRKSHLVDAEWTLPADRSATFTDEVVMHGLHLRAPEVQPGSFLFVELGLSSRPRPSDPIRVWLVLTGEDGQGQLVHDLSLGLEEWYPVSEWKAGEIVHNRVAVPIDKTVPLGTYTASVVVVGPDGVLPALEAGPAGSIEAEPLYAAGEAQFAGAVRVVPAEQVRKLATADLNRAVRLANGLKCTEAEEAWMDARATYIRSMDWQASVRPRVKDAIANCWATRAQNAEYRGDAVVAIRRARWWDPVHPRVLAVGSALADLWFPKAVELRDAGRIGDAYEAFTDVLYADPGRAWARRYAEELRAERLRLQ